MSERANTTSARAPTVATAAPAAARTDEWAERAPDERALEARPERVPAEVAEVQVHRGLDAVTPATLRRQIELLHHVRCAAIQQTSPHQWTVFGDTVYLNGSGGAAMRYLLGLSVTEPEFEHEPLPGGGWVVRATLRVGKGDCWVVGFDECSTYDDLIAMHSEILEEAGAPQEAIERLILNACRKKAYSGALGRAVSDWLGVRDLHVEDLARLGIQVTARVQFKRRRREDGAPARKPGGTASNRGRAQPRNGGNGAPARMTVAELMRQAVGARARVVGEVAEHRAGHTRDGSDYCDFAFTDDTARVWMRYWSALPEWVSQGGPVEATVEVREWAGGKQYVAAHLEPPQEAHNG